MANFQVLSTLVLWDNEPALPPNTLPRKRDLYTRLVYARRLPGLGRLAYYLLKLMGSEIPRPVRIGEDFELAHGGFGVVIHPQTVIGDRVKLYPGVTLGRADIYRPATQSKFGGILVEDDVILAPGAKVLCQEGQLRIGRGTVVGANAVLLESTGEYEIWAGVPARCAGRRPALSTETAPPAGVAP